MVEALHRQEHMEKKIEKKRTDMILKKTLLS